MKTLLAVHSSARITRSVTRPLTARFIRRWLAANPDGRVIERDVGTRPPSSVDEDWIAAAFSDSKSSGIPEALAESERLIAEIAKADLVVMGAPLYNFGMPAQLKAYFDQIVRMGRTVAFDPEAAKPYRPLLKKKPVVVITSAGNPAMYPGGAFAHHNHLEPHLRTVFGFIGLTDLHFVRASPGGNQTGGPLVSAAIAEKAVDQLVDALCKNSSQQLTA